MFDIYHKSYIILYKMFIKSLSRILIGAILFIIGHFLANYPVILAARVKHGMNFLFTMISTYA